MSSPSPTISNQSECLVVGNAWAGAVVTRSFLEAGARPVFLELPAKGAPPDAVSWFGNGECWKNATLVFGPETAAALWEVSRESFERAKRIALETGVGAPGRMAWYAQGERERRLLEASSAGAPGARWDADAGILSEPSVAWSLARLAAALKEETGPRRIERVERIEKRGSLEYRVVYRAGGREETAEASVVVFVSDDISPELFPSFSDKWLPVTLTSVRAPQALPRPFQKSIFHLGADFAVSTARGLTLGSYRNLYEDKAVGFHDTPDPATINGVARFFGDLGWAKKEDLAPPDLSMASLSCDGLPLVGALPDLPGVYLVGAFAARAQNFIFEVAHRLAQGVVRGQGFGGLAVFSTKRFV